MHYAINIPSHIDYARIMQALALIDADIIPATPKPAAKGRAKKASPDIWAPVIVRTKAGTLREIDGVSAMKMAAKILRNPAKHVSHFPAAPSLAHYKKTCGNVTETDDKEVWSSPKATAEYVKTYCSLNKLK